MKVLYFSKSSIPSRTANSLHVMKMCQAFARNGHEVWFCILTETLQKRYSVTDIFSYYAVRECFQLLSIPVFPDKGRKLRFLLSHLFIVPYIFNVLRKIKPDIVYGRDIFSCYVAACLGYPVVAESHFPLWHGKIASFAFERLHKHKNFKRLVVISEALKKEYLLHYSDLTTSQVVVAHDGADPVESNKLCKEEIGTSETLKVGYIGHLYEGKGLEVIAAIASRIPDIEFHIIGGLDDDIQKWKQRIDADNVTFHGFVQQGTLPGYLKALDICLLPNQYKVLAHGADRSSNIKNISLYTSPLKMFEYMAHGKAIVASDLPVLREVLNEDIAILVKPDDYPGWIASINLLRDEVLRNNLGRRAKNLFLKEYTWGRRAVSVLDGLEK